VLSYATLLRKVWPAWLLLRKSLAALALPRAKLPKFAGTKVWLLLRKSLAASLFRLEATVSRPEVFVGQVWGVWLR